MSFLKRNEVFDADKGPLVPVTVYGSLLLGLTLTAVLSMGSTGDKMAVAMIGFFLTLCLSPLVATIVAMTSESLVNKARLKANPSSGALRSAVAVVYYE